MENIEQKENVTGLSAEEVTQREKQGLTNAEIGVKTKTEKQIILSHSLNFFNILNIIFAGLIFFVGIIDGVDLADIVKNMLFMGVIFSNTGIGIFQEIRSKRIVDKLNIISQLKVAVVRDGQTVTVPVWEIVLDDTVKLKTGNQVFADCVLVQGEVEVNESLLTGEADAIVKTKGDKLLSGSFVVSGQCFAKVEHVGAQNYANKIVQNAKYVKKSNSDIMKSLNILVKIIGYSLIPLGTILFFKQYFILGDGLSKSVFSAVAAMISMIPEGLILLTSMVFAISVIRLSAHKTLVQDLYSVETLARVDVLCLDKTGTITQGTMQVDKIVTLKNDYNQICKALSALGTRLKDDNATINAIRDFAQVETSWESLSVVPFSSKRKWSAVSFKNKGTYVLGASEFVLKDNPFETAENNYSKNGQRVLVLAYTDDLIYEKKLPKNLKPVALIVLSDKIRKDAKQTLDFFEKQSVKVKIISGDNPVTVASVAKKAGLKNSEKYIDMSVVEDEKIEEIVLEYNIFGRVSPEQKLKLVKALQKNGHVVAMTGDGVNDVLALKEADCSIAMASGSDAARTVSNIVLLNSDFSAMPLVVREGRRSINNLQRSASLFLTKTTYSVLLSLLFVFVSVSYPFEPIHVTLIGSLAIGIPSFILALEPNTQLVKGKFLVNVVKKAVPAGFSIFLGITALVIASTVFGYTSTQVSTMAVIITISLAFRHLAMISRPFNILRTCLLSLLIISFIVIFVAFKGLFDFTAITVSMFVCTILILAFVIILLSVYESKSKSRK
ncbi:MAG: HAD-IC family P-type ATPase [Clostridia bacterium]